MKDLIELTGQEVSLEAAGITFTLKEIADKFSIRHKDLKDQFEKDLNSLSEDKVSERNFRSEKYEVITGKNTKRTYDTYRLGIRETVWVISRFKADLRLQVVDYAFDKLKEEHERDMLLLEKENKKLEKKVNKLELDKFNDWDEEYTTASRYVKEHPELNITASDLLDMMSDSGLIETKIVTRQVRLPVEGKSLHGKKGTLLIREFDIDKLFKA